MRTIDGTAEFEALPVKVSAMEKGFCRTISQFWYLNNTIPEVLRHDANSQSAQLEMLSPAGMLFSFHMRRSKLREVVWLSSGHRAEHILDCGQSKNLRLNF